MAGDFLHSFTKLLLIVIIVISVVTGGFSGGLKMIGSSNYPITLSDYNFADMCN